MIGAIKYMFDQSKLYTSLMEKTSNEMKSLEDSLFCHNKAWKASLIKVKFPGLTCLLFFLLGMITFQKATVFLLIIQVLWVDPHDQRTVLKFITINPNITKAEENSWERTELLSTFLQKEKDDVDNWKGASPPLLIFLSFLLLTQLLLQIRREKPIGVTKSQSNY